jgi:glutamate-1-semialdehyde 2,1-aminomutase
MQQVAPAGPMYQAGTLSGNPLAMTAGLVTLQELTKPGMFAAAAVATEQLVTGIEAAAAAAGKPIQAGCAGTMFGFYFLKREGTAVTNYAEAKQYADPALYGRFFHAMLEQGVYFAPSQFEAGFVSTAHGAGEIGATHEAMRTVLGDLR